MNMNETIKKVINSRLGKRRMVIRFHKCYQSTLKQMGKNHQIGSVPVSE